MIIELDAKEQETLQMFYESKDNPLKHYSNNLALEGNLVETLELTKKGLVSQVTGENNRAYFAISEKGLNYLNTIKD